VVAASDLSVAIVGASAGVVGAVLGSAVTGWVAVRAEDRRQRFAREQESERTRRDDERERIVTLGAARLWRMRLLRIKFHLHTGIRRRRWWPITYELPEIPPLDDQKRIASLVDAQSWTKIQRGEFALDSLMARRRRREQAMDENEEVPPFRQSDESFLRRVRILLDGAVVELGVVAGVDPEDDFVFRDVEQDEIEEPREEN
jgi:hypothetical protein